MKNGIIRIFLVLSNRNWFLRIDFDEIGNTNVLFVFRHITWQSEEF